MQIADPIAEKQIASAKQRLAELQMCWGNDHPKLLTELSNLADLYFVLEDYAHAEELYQRVLSIQFKRYGENHIAVVTSTLSLAEIYDELERWEEAERHYILVIAILQTIDPMPEEAPVLRIRALLKLYGLYKKNKQNERCQIIEQYIHSLLLKSAIRGTNSGPDNVAEAKFLHKMKTAV